MREDSGYRKQRAEERASEASVEPAVPVGDRTIRRSRCTSQVWVGAAIVVFGAALLLDNLGVIESSRQILRFWPVILIAAGIGDLFAARARGRAMRGTLLTAFGSLLLLNNLGIVNFNVWQLWPLFLIVFGVQILMRSRSRPGAAADVSAAGEAEFDDFAFLGGVKRSNNSSAFRGGSATAFMGGVELDLRNARMDGDSAVVNVFAMMGGVTMRIPEDWAVKSNVVAILGGVDDKTRPPRDPAGTLILQGSAIMGGVEIKD